MHREKDILALIATKQTTQEGFRLLVQQFRKPIYWHIRRLVVCHEDAEDVMQECFVNIYKYIGNFKQEASLKTWIYRVATNEALRFCTKKRLNIASYDEKSLLVCRFESEPDIDMDSVEATLQKAILSLPQQQQVTFNLRYFDEMSYEEMAEVTGSSIGALKTNYHYAIGKVKAYMVNNLDG